jgi:hypothetical protein
VNSVISSLEPRSTVAVVAKTALDAMGATTELAFTAAAGGVWYGFPFDRRHRTILVTRCAGWVRNQVLLKSRDPRGPGGPFGFIDVANLPADPDEQREALVLHAFKHGADLIVFDGLAGDHPAAFAKQVARACGAGVLFGCGATDCWLGADAVLEVEVIGQASPPRWDLATFRVRERRIEAPPVWSR